MTGGSATGENVRQVVPFLRVASMQHSVRFYLDGLGFAMKNQWVVAGELRWCWLARGGASLMLQKFHPTGRGSETPEPKVGIGISLCFQCEDAIAIYREGLAHGLEASEPEVGNAMWVTTILDPDGYRLQFESATDVPEDTKLSELKR